MTAWFTEVCPDVITPSTGTVSPGSTRRISPTLTCSAGIVFSPASVSTLAVCGVRCTSFSIPALALATVSSSKSPPSCMINATSPAAKSSLMSTDAIRASKTSTSALISNSVTSPMTASRMIGIPQRMIATHAGSNGRSSLSKMLIRSATAEITRNRMSLLVPPNSRSSSSLSVIFFTLFLSFIPIGVYVIYGCYYTYGGIGCQWVY